ncbi:MAG: hypothetical protein QOK24_2729 [Verrucomicrobiota bacterium]|jgi:hypothetical protein
MDETESKPFRTGERYENRRGLFEVISIDGDSMRLRWDTGAEVATSVALQAKILANMDRELAEASAEKRGKVPRSFGEFFRGLQPADFADDVTGTHWRSREQLGGAVTKLLEVGEPFNSWSIYGRSEIHWASVSRYGLTHPSLQTKFFARANPLEILVGVYLERSDKPTDNQDDWLRFVAWLAQPLHASWLHATLRHSGSVITNPYTDWSNLSFYGSMTPTEGGYSWARPGQADVDFPPDQLIHVLGNLSKEHWLNLVLGRAISKAAALAQAERIAGTIADLFNGLLPVYQSRAPA